MAREGFVRGMNLKQNLQQASVGSKTRSANIMLLIPETKGKSHGLI
jgi:hypothetical protein